MSPSRKKKRNSTKQKRAAWVVFFSVLYIGLLHMVTESLMFFNIGRDYITSLAYTWTLAEIIMGFGSGIVSVYYFGVTERLIVESRESIVRRTSYRIKKVGDKLQNGQQEIKDIATEILTKIDPEQARHIIEYEYDVNERNLIEDELQKRIENIDSRLKAFKNDTLTLDRASLLEDQGRIYWLLSLIRERESRINKSLEAINKALEFFTVGTHPEEHARLKRLLGNVYATATYADVSQKKKNYELAINAYRESYNFYSLPDYPLDYAKVMNNIGVVFHKFIEISDSEDNYKEAICAYNRALVVFIPESDPDLYAKIMNNVGATYSIFSQLVETEDVRMHCELAIAAFTKALKIRTPTDYRVDYATTQNNLGIAYAQLAKVHDRKKNCQLAIDAFERALEIRKVEDYPLYHASTLYNLGNVLIELAKVHSRVDNCSHAISLLLDAQNIYTFEEYPERYLKVQNSIDYAHQVLRLIP